jgi:hypothetical protein
VALVEVVSQASHYFQNEYRQVDRDLQEQKDRNKAYESSKRDENKYRDNPDERQLIRMKMALGQQQSREPDMGVDTELVEVARPGLEIVCQPTDDFAENVFQG